MHKRARDPLQGVTHTIYIKILYNINIMSYIKLKIQNIQVQCDISPGRGEGALPHLAQTVMCHYYKRVKGFQDFKS